MKYGQYGLKQTYLREIEEDYTKEIEEIFDYIDNIKKRVYENLKLQRKDIQTLRNIITKNLDILENLEDIHSEKELLKLIISNNISKNIKGKNDEEIEDIIKNKCGLAVDFGSWFGGQKYAGFIRINLATSRENIEILLDRLALIREDK